MINNQYDFREIKKDLITNFFQKKTPYLKKNRPTPTKLRPPTLASPVSPLLGQSTYFVVSRSRSFSAKRGSLDSDVLAYIIRENDDAELDPLRFGSMRKEAVARGAHRGGRTLHLRKVAVADIPETVEDFDIFA